MWRRTRILIVLAMTSAANASLTLVPPQAIHVGQTAALAVDAAGENTPLSGCILFEGPVSVNISGVTLAEVQGISHAPSLIDVNDMIEIIEIEFPVPYSTALSYNIINFGPPLTIPDGRMIDGVALTGKEAGQVIITLLDTLSGEIIDSVEVSILPCEPRVIHVDADAPGVGDGSSWADAYNHVHDALADAETGQKPAEIRVAQGIYKPEQITVGEPPHSLTWTEPFQLISGVALRGGYAGYGQTNPDMRDVGKYETILSGDLAGNDEDVADPCDLLDEPTRSDNSDMIVLAHEVDETAVLDGFTVAGGQHNAVCILPCGGAGMGNSAANPTIVNCTFCANAALDSGGAMFNGANSAPTIVNCVFEGNYAGNGGAIANYDSGSDPMLMNCAFVGNRAYSGGGMSSQRNTSFALINCTFTGNTAEYCKALGCSRIQQGTVKNCILWDGGDEISGDPNSVVEITYSNVQGGSPGESNIDADPCFANPASYDYHLKSQAGRWDASSSTWVQDEVTSPCIDAGDPASPIGQEQFPNGGVVNMGAYGGTVEASKSWFGGPVCETIVAGDVNGDCVVDFLDLSIMMLHWLEGQ